MTNKLKIISRGESKTLSSGELKVMSPSELKTVSPDESETTVYISPGEPDAILCFAL